MVTDLLQGTNPAASWVLALVVLVVVSAVVWLLLHLVARTAIGINAGVAEVWERGQRVANNTIHIPLLYRTNALAGELLASAGAIAGATAAIEAHARACPGCPACLLATPAQPASGAAP